MIDTQVYIFPSLFSFPPFPSLVNFLSTCFFLALTLSCICSLHSLMYYVFFCVGSSGRTVKTKHTGVCPLLMGARVLGGVGVGLACTVNDLFFRGFGRHEKNNNEERG